MNQVLIVHIVAGGLGLLLVPVVTRSRKRRGGLHVWAGRVFASLALLVAATALVRVAAAPGELLGLGVLGVLTGVWSAGGWWVARARPTLPGGWRVWHLNLMGSAAIGFVTAFVVQVADGHVLAWILPSVVGSVVIARATTRHRRSGTTVGRDTADIAAAT